MFTLKSKYKPTGDQPYAIDKITKYLNDGHKFQSLWGVTGSGKTFVMANIIEKIDKPTLIVAHNKTLRAQLAMEFRDFFPDARVHYFVSYYDYYQPEAYVNKTDTYIEKEATINEEIDRLRHRATQDLILRKDVIIVASVSCIYGVGDISAYKDAIFQLEVGGNYVIDDILKKLVRLQYKRAGEDFKSGMFSVMGDLLEIFPSSREYVYSIEFFGDDVDRITLRDPLTGEIFEEVQYIDVFPRRHVVTSDDTLSRVVPQIKAELEERYKYFIDTGQLLKAERLKTKVEYDIEMMMEVGYVNGIENYSKYLDGREDGEPPHTLIDYFGDDFLCFIDESHMTISQIGGMYNGDRSRKENLVEYGFRLPSALDHRPLRFEEFESKIPQMVLVSATPGKYDIEKSTNNPDKFFNFDPLVDGAWVDSPDERIVPLVIRPTGLLDPHIELRSMEFMIDDIMNNIKQVIDSSERMLITTLTKRSSEELTDYLLDNGVKVKYLHSEVETLDRLGILGELRSGKIDVIVGVNLLREGLDLPEVTKIAILDRDKQGFLRSTGSLIQIIGRARRNSKGTVYMYSQEHFTTDLKLDLKNPDNFLLLEGGLKLPLYRFDKGRYMASSEILVSESMRVAININNYRRALQADYNERHNITPTTVYSKIKDIGIESKKKSIKNLSQKDLQKTIKKLEFEMSFAAENMDYELRAELRDELFEYKKQVKS